MQINRTADKMTIASYSGTFTFAELDNLTGIRQASLELLEKSEIIEIFDIIAHIPLKKGCSRQSDRETPRSDC